MSISPSCSSVCCYLTYPIIIIIIIVSLCIFIIFTITITIILNPITILLSVLLPRLPHLVHGHVNSGLPGRGQVTIWHFHQKKCVFIQPKSEHCLALSVTHWLLLLSLSKFVKVATWIWQIFLLGFLFLAVCHSKLSWGFTKILKLHGLKFQ